VRLAGKTAIVVGGASGIGRAVAQRFVQEGARVVVADLDQERGEELVGELGPQAVFMRVDATVSVDVTRMVDQTCTRVGLPDILHMNQWWQGRTPLVETSEAEWERTLSVCLTSAFLCAKAVIPVMRGRGGSIIGITSVGGIVGFPRQTAYTVAKAGLIQLMKSIAIDYGPEKVRANTIAPGIIETPETRERIQERHDWYMEEVVLKSIGQPTDIAEASVYLASDESRYVTGTTLVVDGGWTLL